MVQMPFPSLILLHSICMSTFLFQLVPAKQLDYPTANISTQWIAHSDLSINSSSFSDNTLVIPLLLQGQLGLSFSFGFYCRAQPCTSYLLSVFIVYTDATSVIARTFDAFPQVIWTANRDSPVRPNATLSLTKDGDLILRDVDGALVWSTGTSGQGATALTLLESGNLALIDGEGILIWSSFDYPADVLFVGQTLKQGQRLTANSSATNTTKGQFFLSVDSEGFRCFIDSSPPQPYFVKAVSGKHQNGSTSLTLTNKGLNLFVSSTDPNKPDFSLYQLNVFVSVLYARLEADGLLRVYGWFNEWMFLIELTFTSNSCFFPTICGNYGICSNLQCSCPHGGDGSSSYFIPVNATQMNRGCDLVTPISCQDIQKHKLLALDKVSYFGYAHNSSIAMHMTDVESCKQACLASCSCKAAFFQSEEGSLLGSCYLPTKIFSLINNTPELTGYNSTSFIRVQPSFPISPGSPRIGKTENLRMKITIGVVSGFILSCLLVLLICIINVIRRRKTAQVERMNPFDELPGMPLRFSYEEIKLATKDFKQMLGKGGFGTVFKGTLSNGTDVAVKRLDAVNQGSKQFLAEVVTICGIHHINLIKLIGFCDEKSHKLLVFEFMLNGSLDRWIFPITEEHVLDWKTKRAIILDIAKGLSYLHEGCQQRIAHLDIKPQNILLDEKFRAKVADFGLSKLIDRDRSETTTRMRGTPGYLAPEWLTSIITEKVDVYSFGVVVIEIICGRKNLDPSQPEDAVHLVALIQEKLKDNLLLDFFDKNNSEMKLHSDEVLEMLRLAIWCLQSDCSRRPSMSMIVKALECSSDTCFSIDYEFLGGKLFI